MRDDRSSIVDERKSYKVKENILFHCVYIFSGF